MELHEGRSLVLRPLSVVDGRPPPQLHARGPKVGVLMKDDVVGGEPMQGCHDLVKGPARGSCEGRQTIRFYRTGNMYEQSF